MRALGRIEQNTENLKGHITSVSAKVDDVRDELRSDIKGVVSELTTHKEDTGAHGAALKETLHEKAGLSRREGILTACAIAGVLVALMQWFQARSIEAKTAKDGFYSGRSRWERSRADLPERDAPATIPAPTTASAFPTPKETTQ